MKLYEPVLITLSLALKLLCRDVYCSIVRPLLLDILLQKQLASTSSFHQNTLLQKQLERTHSFRQRTEGSIGLDRTKELNHAQMYVTLLSICQQAKVPMEYVEIFAGLLRTDKLENIGRWSERSSKLAEWNIIASHFVQVYTHCTASKKLVLLALDDINGMDEMSWKIIQRLYKNGNGFMVISAARNELGVNAQPEFWNELHNKATKSERFAHIILPPLSDDNFKKVSGKRLTRATSQRKLSQAVYLQSKGDIALAGDILADLYAEKQNGENLTSEEADCVEELLLNSLDSLSPSARSHLNLCAILGLTFSLSKVVSVMERYNNVPKERQSSHASAVENNLQEAVDNGILKLKEKGETTTYCFSHQFWQETLSKQSLGEWKQDMMHLIAAIE